MIITITATSTYVCWDLVDFPLPNDEIDSFYTNVKSTLREEGYMGEVSITAYGHRERSTPKEIESVHQSIHLVRLTVADYDECPLELKPSCTVWLWESLLQGGCPIPTNPEMEKRVKERRIKERMKEMIKEMMRIG
ncbi:unnamed protein product [Microthlaspi erraticum]|uniref:NYN domain-containing protein n=1 Tax=Microthlaspi erraticum TaxID=1685480 RepID=A0A6D2JDA4_9BRAS|nr:unnamed protein product [Microthlaspi erraticum]